MNTPDLLALAAGLALAVFGVSGILNSTGLAPHPGWLPVALVLAALAAASTARSMAIALRTSSDEPSSSQEP